MNNEQIKQLEKELWDAADNLRANSKLTAAEYKDPVLGLILLRYAQNGTELKSNNTRLAKMNLAIHGIEGRIIESNSFYSDPHDLVEKYDFVIANPPFNVNKVDKNKDFVKTDRRE